MRLWRLIESGDRDAYYNMAMDEAIAKSVGAGEAPATLRFYGWLRPSVTIGCFQRAGGLRLDYINEKGIPLVRRPTGGRAILHGRELTCSLSALSSDAPGFGALFESYDALRRAFVKAFALVGLSTNETRERGGAYSRTPRCFGSSSHGEIMAGGTKVMGAAQKRYPWGFLQQGSVPLAVDLAEAERVFGAADPVSAAACSTTGMSLDDIRAAVINSFEEEFGVRFSREKANPLEEGRSEALLREKYLRPEWNLRR